MKPAVSNPHPNTDRNTDKMNIQAVLFFFINSNIPCSVIYNKHIASIILLSTPLYFAYKEYIRLDILGKKDYLPKNT